ncbi:MAG TPA: DUF2306 domain-containing protein [Polyangiaceae bacterium]|nr:DUF2306 domain-containing protein [Polyangiaceae bacterium]
MGRYASGVFRGLFLLLMFAGAAYITAASLEYFEPGVVAPFVMERLGEVRFATLWLWSLKVHVACALVSFPLCLVLTMRWLQRRPLWHRWLGRVTGTLLLVGLVPSGMILAFDATGGLGVSAGFWLSGAIVAVATVYGVRAARRRELNSHSHAMRHVVAQMSVAVTSRAMLIGLDTWSVDPDTAYVVALWVPVLFSAGVAEAISRRFRWPLSWVRSLRTSLASAFSSASSSFIQPVAKE